MSEKVEKIETDVPVEAEGPWVVIPLNCVMKPADFERFLDHETSLKVALNLFADNVLNDLESVSCHTARQVRALEADRPLVCAEIRSAVKTAVRAEFQNLAFDGMQNAFQMTVDRLPAIMHGIVQQAIRYHRQGALEGKAARSEPPYPSVLLKNLL